MDETQSSKEERIRKITHLYYSRPEVQEALFEFSKDREVVPRYFEGFGKRPDSLQYPSDVFELVKKGATSFHSSEELWKDPLKIETGMNEKQLNEIRKGWDLCLPDYETIFVEEDNEIKKITIKELAANLNINSLGRFEVKKNLKVISVNPSNYQVEYDTIRDIIIREQKEGEKVIKITVEDGKKIFVSEDHPILILTSEGLKQKFAKDITKDDYLLIPLKLDFPESKKSVDLIELLKKNMSDTIYKIKYRDSNISWILIDGNNYYNKIPSSIKRYIAEDLTPLNFYLNLEENKNNRKNISIKTRRSNLSIPAIIKLDYSFGKLIGYYLSEGSIDQDRIEFTFNKNELREAKEVISLFNLIFDTDNSNKKTINFHKFSNSLKVRINSKLLSLLFKEVLGFSHHATRKEIPDWVYNSPKDFVAGILTGYFIGDGSCIYEWNKKSLRIDAASASKNLIEGLSLLCIKLGIACNIIEYPPKIYILRISGEEGVQEFANQCREFMDKKNKKILLKLINHPSKHSMYPPFFDKSSVKTIKDRTVQSNIYRAIRTKSRINKKIIFLAADNNIKNIINNNLFPIKVNKIERLEYSGLFYDIETVKNHNFLQGCGIFTHNCIDIDSKYIDYSKVSCQVIIKFLNFYGVKNVGIKFSGNKGFHLIIPWKSLPKEVNGAKTQEMFPQWARIIVQFILEKTRADTTRKILNLINSEEDDKYNIARKYIQREGGELDKGDINKAIEKLKTDEDSFNKEVIPDLILVSPRHLFRMPYSLHEKTALASIVLSPEEIKTFQPTDANPLTIKIRNFMPNSKEGEASRLFIEALDWYKGKASPQKTFEQNSGKFKPIKFEKLSEDTFPPSIRKILEGIKDGKKRALFILINFFRFINMEKEEIEKRIFDWNKKNTPPLMEGYIRTQLDWAYKKQPILPPNYDKDYYKGIGIIPTQEEINSKNPVNYMVRKNYKPDKIKTQKNKDNFKNLN